MLILFAFAGHPLRLFASTPPPSIPAQATAAPLDTVKSQLSPDGQWEALLNQTAGSLDLVGPRHTSYSIFPPGSGLASVHWSPDSSRLLLVRPYYVFDREQGTLLHATQPIEIWQVRTLAATPPSAQLLYRASQEELERDGAQQVVFGDWSPNNRYVLMWVGMLSASILSDGLPPFVLDTDSGQAQPAAIDSAASQQPREPSAADVALTNPRYHSWSPNSSWLAITVGGYRSAQINKWLNLVEVSTGQVTTVVSQTEQIPGIVAWSPAGDVIAYAAVPAEQTSDEWADWMAFDNPAIAGRRIYLLDPLSGQHRRLNEVESYQDAPVWSCDGQRLYYVQRDGDLLHLMVADPATGRAEPVPGASRPLVSQDGMGTAVGYFGQFGRDELLEHLPEQPCGAPERG